MNFRKMFYLVCIVLLAILVALKYILLPQANPKEKQPKRILRHVLDTLIPFILVIIGLASLIFWMSGNAG